MEIIQEALNGVKLIRPTIHEDHRGYFYESYNINTFKGIGIEDSFLQDNQSLSTRPGVLRGLHFQNAPFEQAKLVRVIHGAVLDVAVDIRVGSPTYGEYFSAELTEKNKHLMYVPTGFAHGFLVLEPNTLFSYKCSNVYDGPSEEGIAWNDPDIGIDWNYENPILSDKDQKNYRFADFKSKFLF